MSDELMEPSEWLAEAQACDVGTKNKVTHLCGDASLVVYNNVDSWTAWCWRCHTRGWVPKPEANMRERLARKAQQKELDNAISYQVRQPFPACFDLTSWSPTARLWLYKAGLNAGLIRELGAYYHKPTGRVVLPILDAHGATVFWQARNPEYPQGGPKYISASVPRDRLHAIYRPHNGDGMPRVYAALDGRGSGGDEQGTGTIPFVLTEDILSAFKVGMSGAGTGYAVMGTALGQHTLALLVRDDAPVILWFDPDGAGESARATITKQLRLVGIVPASLTTPKDPKHYCLADIKRLINEHSKG